MLVHANACCMTGKRARSTRNTRRTLTNNMKLGADVFERSQTTQDTVYTPLFLKDKVPDAVKPRAGSR